MVDAGRVTARLALCEQVVAERFLAKCALSFRGQRR